MNTSSAKHSEHTTNIQQAKVLIVDDNVDLLRLMSMRLRPMRLELKTATSAEEGLSVLAHWPADLVITDLQMPGMSGMELFDRVHENNPILPVIMLTAHGTILEAVSATQSGMASYLPKPFDSEMLVSHIEMALIKSGFSGGRGSNEALVNDQSWRKDILAKSILMESLLTQIERLAETDCLIAFEGEPGCGKERLARAVHARSKRANKPYLRLECTAQTPLLMEIEVFGKVADPDAGVKETIGLLQRAAGGTLLVSDFNEASPKFLRKLLLALVNGKAAPVNSSEPYPVDVRAITTTSLTGGYSLELQELGDLSTKLELAVMRVPPLRDRREDIPLIVNQCLQNEFADLDLQFSTKAIQLLLTQDWPGNIRQLLNVVRQCARLCTTKIISEALVNSRTDSQLFRIRPLTNAHAEFEREYLTELLRTTNGNVTLAATLAKRNRTEVHRLLSKHKIIAKSFRQ